MQYLDWKAGEQCVWGIILSLWTNSILICVAWHCLYGAVSMDNVLTNFVLEARLPTAGKFFDWSTRRWKMHLEEINSFASHCKYPKTQWALLLRMLLSGAIVWGFSLQLRSKSNLAFV
jgi:hypothetical protein